MILYSRMPLNAIWRIAFLMGKSPVVQAVLLSRISIPTNSNDITWAETRVVEKTEGGGECHTGAPSQSPPQLGILPSLAAI
jgi:hypothetical protein